MSGNIKMFESFSEGNQNFIITSETNFYVVYIGGIERNERFKSLFKSDIKNFSNFIIGVNYGVKSENRDIIAGLFGNLEDAIEKYKEIKEREEIPLSDILRNI